MSNRTLEQLESVLAVLPQTQCTQCGYEGCRPYAQAIVDGTADINRCPPGGQTGVQRLSVVTGIAAKPLDTTCGVTKPRHIAVIDPARCIGCTLCIAACPVDAIVGAPKAMHQVISKACTGCDLCLPPCPVDCISMVVIQGYDQWTDQDATLARLSYEQRGLRLKQQALAQSQRQVVKAQEKIDAIAAGHYDSETLQDSRKQAAIKAALEKVRLRRS